MRNLAWICCFLCQSLPTLTAYPLNPATFSKGDNSYWELYYAVGLLSITATAFTLVGCLCCRRNRPKGFKDNEEKKEQEFKNGTDTGLHNSFHGLELEVPQIAEPVQFDPLPVDRFVAESPKPKPPLTFDKDDADRSTSATSSQEWQKARDLHVSREKLKYVREVGHGWFGKVVEGCIDTSSLKRNLRSGNVVVRILTEEATVKEKAWFLGEATPYFKLRHRNILSLLGSCLEADPYLLLFEACPAGDLKGFLRSNSDDQSRTTLIKENMPIRISIEVAAGLRHMHEHGFAHTDLSARNCLVAADLSIKLGDYGTGVEKYPDDYYVVGDRALPIRWSAPESLFCTETTIETREITHKANIWSFAILLWEIATWGERPYDELGDEQVIEMLLSTGPKLDESLNLLMSRLQNVASSMVQTIQAGLVLAPEKRPELAELRHMLLKDKLDAEDFEQRWESLGPTKIKDRRSASLQDLRGSVDSESWSNIIEEKERIASPVQVGKFRLGPEEPIKNVPGIRVNAPEFQLSDSETEEESWRGRIERGAYTEKVKQKSKSVADLMVLVYIDPDSDAELSLGAVCEKPAKKRLYLTGSDSDLHSLVLEDNFDQALKNLREPAPTSISDTYIRTAFASLEKLNQSAEPVIKLDLHRNESLPRIPSIFATSSKLNFTSDEEGFSNNFDQVKSSDEVTLWSNALDSALEQKVGQGFLEEAEFQSSSNAKRGDETGYNSSDTVQLTPSSLEHDGDFCALESPEIVKAKASSRSEDDEEYRKRVSTPDDERSSDSGFRDKESCEDEESPLQRLPKSKFCEPTEEEQLRILMELDNILDAEYTGTPTDSLEYSNLLSSSLMNQQQEARCLSPAGLIPSSKEEENYDRLASRDSSKNEANILDSEWQLEQSSCTDTTQIEAANLPPDSENDDDSSTMSLRSDNSYISFNMDEEFVTAIRNELREKLPHAQMLVVEPMEPRDEDEPSSVASDDPKSWDEDLEPEHGSGVELAIRYNIYGAQLSPILEERESALNSESLVSKDNSFASRCSISEEELLLVDTQTNEAMMMERPRIETSDTSDDEDDNNVYECSAPSIYQENVMRIGAPLPSPEEESKWQKIACSFPLPAQVSDDCMMSTSFAAERDWQRNEVEEDEEDNSSSSGEFVWKRYDKSRPDLIDTHVQKVVSKVEEEDLEETEENQVEPETEKKGEKRKAMEEEEDEDLDDDEEEEEEEEEFTPSAWDATLAPHRSALRSPDKSVKSGDQKKSVWFKKQNYHCVYEYPKEVTTVNHEPTAMTWEPTTYADWEEMMDESRLDLYPLDYDDSNASKTDEFYVTSSNRPFQFQTGDKYTSQFFPGASSKISQMQSPGQSNKEDETSSSQSDVQSKSQSLGELRHTRDRLKLNLNGANVGKLQSRQNNNNESEPGETSAADNHAEAGPPQFAVPLKLSPSDKGNVDYNENCGFLKQG